ncbi:hypothetical protein HK102_005565, partial [Quaeritorhiza haematococci]
MPSAASSSSVSSVSSASSVSSSKRPLKLNKNMLDVVMPLQTPDAQQEYARLKKNLDTASHRLDCLKNASRGLTRGSADVEAWCKDFTDKIEYWREQANAHKRLCQ